MTDTLDTISKRRRGARPGQVPREQRRETFNNGLQNGFDQLHGHLPPAGSRMSVPLESLRGRVDEILGVMANGWSVRAISRTLADSFEYETFTEHTIAKAISRLLKEHEASAKSAKAPAKAPVATAQAKAPVVQMPRVEVYQPRPVWEEPEA